MSHIVTDENSKTEQAIVLHPLAREDSLSLRNADARLEEAIGLAVAINLDVVYSETIRLTKKRPATLLGLGKVEEIKANMDARDIRPGLVIIDGTLTPVQHRNLEESWQAKVLDRTALILEIFGARAQTKEGRLQVDLAHLTYQRSRLVRSWTHLERQRGGSGFLGGPGERQIESDRRVLAEKIDKLKKQIEQVRRTRTLQRAKRKRAPHPVVALVGYTNAGKSTLFNKLTKSSVQAQDLLFATLDPTMRAVDLPSTIRVIFSDTVGFISDLPTELVAAFRATLEEVNEADLILHVRDAAHGDTDAQRQDVLAVLKNLGVEDTTQRPVIEVLNKTDLMSEEILNVLEKTAAAKREIAIGTLDDPWPIPVSAISGAGAELLYVEIDRCLTLEHQEYHVEVATTHGAALAWLYAHGEVIDVTDNDGLLMHRVKFSDKNAGQFEKEFAIKMKLLSPVRNVKKEPVSNEPYQP